MPHSLCCNLRDTVFNNSSFRFRILASLLIFIPAAYADEYSKSATFDQTPEQVFAAAERVVRRDFEGRILERDEQRHLLRFRWDLLRAGRWNESKAASYAIFNAELDPRTGKTKAHLTFGRVDDRVPPLPSTAQVADPSFTKRFFRALKHELSHR